MFLKYSMMSQIIAYNQRKRERLFCKKVKALPKVIDNKHILLKVFYNLVHNLMFFKKLLNKGYEADHCEICNNPFKLMSTHDKLENLTVSTNASGVSSSSVFPAETPKSL